LKVVQPPLANFVTLNFFWVIQFNKLATLLLRVKALNTVFNA